MGHQVFKELSHKIRKILIRMVEIDPSKRISSEQLRKCFLPKQEGKPQNLRKSLFLSKRTTIKPSLKQQSNNLNKLNRIKLIQRDFARSPPSTIEQTIPKNIIINKKPKKKFFEALKYTNPWRNHKRKHSQILKKSSITILKNSFIPSKKTSKRERYLTKEPVYDQFKSPFSITPSVLRLGNNIPIKFRSADKLASKKISSFMESTQPTNKIQNKISNFGQVDLTRHHYFKG